MKKFNLKVTGLRVKPAMTAAAVSLMICALFVIASCGSGNVSMNPDDILSDILKSYRENGMTSWWEIVAVYNAGENPMDYKGFGEVHASLEGTTNLKMASYVIVTNIAVVIGADEGYFEEYEPYKAKLKALLENPAPENTLNDYIFAYYALRCSGTEFYQTPVLNYLIEAQKPDGGFALSGDTGDVDVTAFALPALKLLLSADAFDTDMSSLANAGKFLENNIGKNGAFTSYNTENANSTACALSGLISYYGSAINSESPDVSNETVKSALDGLSVFKVPKATGYSFLKGGKADVLATAQAAIALSDVKNKTPVWEKLYLDSLAAFGED